MKGSPDNGPDNSTVSCGFSSRITSESCTPFLYNGSDVCMEQLSIWQHCELGGTNTVWVDSKYQKNDAYVLLEILSKCLVFSVSVCLTVGYATMRTCIIES